MDEADASANPSAQNGQPVQTTSAGDAADITDNIKAEWTPPQNTEPLTSLAGQRILHFLETADNQVLLAFLGALALLVYLVLGRLGLLLIGLVSGFLFHEYWAGLANHGAQFGVRGFIGAPRRKELGIEVAARLLDWTSQRAALEIDHDNEIVRITNDDVTVDSSRYPPATAAALTELVDATIRDYVNYWYKPILPSDDAFPLACRKTLIGFINSLSTHMTRKRSADTFLQFVINSSSMIIVFLNELSLALQSTNPDSLSTEDNVKEYLTKYPESNLANVLSIEQQQKKLKMVADDMLSTFLEPRAYQCDVVKNFLREIFAGVVLESVVKSCSQPDFINGWIVYLLKEGEPEIMNAIDAGLESASKGDIAAFSKIAGRASQDLARAIPITDAQGNGLSRAEQEALALQKPIRQETVLPDDLPQPKEKVGVTVTDKMPSNISEQGASQAPSSEKPAGEEREESSQQIPETKDHEQSFNEIRDAEQENEDSMQILYGASVIVDDGSVPGDKSTIKAKPTTEYMLQIEPASTRYPGWMIFRKYQDFEHLHSGLATLSRFYQVRFLDTHPTLPGYRDKTKVALAKALEHYLRDALEYKELAKSERLRNFLDKDNEFGQSGPTPTKTGLSMRASNTFENMGKGMLGVLSNAPKGVAGSGKIVLDGVSGVFAGVNRSRKSVDITSTLSRSSTVDGSSDALNHTRESPSDTSLQDHPQDQTSSPIINQQAVEPPTDIIDKSIGDTSEPEPVADDSAEQRAAQDIQPSPRSPESSASPSIRKISLEKEDSKSEHFNDAPDSQGFGDDSNTPEKEHAGNKRTFSENPITEDETRVAIELIFAVINELYTLSSAWNIRKTLLNAAKSYVLRPRNPHLESIRLLVQESMIDAHTTDEAIATNIKKLRENSLPTEEELAAWPPPLSKYESQKLKNEAKKLLIERGMPQVLMSVMGAAASGEALGKVFDCLQVEEVGRGFMFALILQALRAVIL